MNIPSVPSQSTNSNANSAPTIVKPRKVVTCSVCGQQGHNKSRHNEDIGATGTTAATAISNTPAPKQSDSEDEDFRLCGAKRLHRHKKHWENDTQTRLNGQHIPLKASTPRDRDINGKLKDRRKACSFCNSKTAYYCHTCKAYLCIGDEYYTSCWTRFHTQECWQRK